MSTWNVEVAAGLVVAGIVAGLAVPRIFGTAERAASAGAFAYLSAVQAAQERHHAREGTYAAEAAALDVGAAVPEGFAASSIRPGATGDIATSWTQTLTRRDAAARQRAYTVTFSQEGFEVAASTVDAALMPPHPRE